MHFRDLNSSREVAFTDSVTVKDADVVDYNSLLKCKQPESGSVLSRVVSPYFIKINHAGVGGGTKDNEGERVRKKKRKKTVGIDFVAHGANDHVEATLERMEKVVEPRKNKENKRKKGKTFLDDQELHTKKKSLVNCYQESGRVIRSTYVTCSDGTRVVSPYFMKMDDGGGGGTKDDQESISERVENVAEPRKNKEKKCKKGRTIVDDQELHTEKKSDTRKIKKRRLHSECCVENGNQNRNSGLESQDLFLSDCGTVVKNEAVGEVCERERTARKVDGRTVKVNSSQEVGFPDSVTIKEANVVADNSLLKCKQENGRVIRSSYVTSNDGTRVVSPYFMKVDDGDGGTKYNEEDGVKKKKRKKTVRIDRSCNEFEREENMAEQEKNMEKKCKRGRTILDDQVLQTKMKSGKKIKKSRVHSECCVEDGNENRNSDVVSQDPFLSVYRTEVKIEAVSADASKVEGRNVVINMERNCDSLAESHEATSPCSENARRKRVKGGNPDKTIDGPRLQVDVEEDEGDEPSCSKFSIVEHARESFDQLLSKYVYKGATVNSVEDNGDKDGANDEVSGKLEKKKERRGIAKTYLTRDEKFLEAYRKKDPNCNWKPPSSPYNLLQEEHAHDPWRVLVICMLLNMTTGSQVRKVLSLFFQLCPNAEAALNTKEIEIARVIQSLGLHWKRAAMIRRFSREYMSEDWTHVTQLHGIGKYAADAHVIFCTGMWDQITPNDHMLNHYWKFLQKRYLRAQEFEKFL